VWRRVISPSLTQGLSSSSNSFLSYTPLYPLYPVVLYSGPISIAAKTAYFLRAITFNTEEPSFFLVRYWSILIPVLRMKNLRNLHIFLFKYIYSKPLKNELFYLQKAVFFWYKLLFEKTNMLGNFQCILLNNKKFKNLPFTSNAKLEKTLLQINLKWRSGLYC
jgi:hypothetical protein